MTQERLHCKNFEGIRTFKKGFSADIPSTEGTETLDLSPAVEGMNPITRFLSLLQQGPVPRSRIPL